MKNQQWYVYGILAIIALVIIKKLGSGISSVGNMLFGDNDDEKRTQSDMNAMPTPRPSMMTISIAQAKEVAATLQRAMDGAGTNEDVMFKALEPLTGEDLYAVYKEFGVRDYGLIMSDKKNLFGWFDGELSGDDREKMVRIWAKSSHKYV
jgi:hypothetical protein